MNKIFVVGFREFWETVKTRTFFFSVVLMPMLIMGLVYGTQQIARLGENEKLPTRTLAIVDAAGGVLAPLIHRVESFNSTSPNRPYGIKPIAPAEADEKQLAQQVASGEYFAYILIPTDAVDGAAPCTIGRRDSGLDVGRQLQDMLNQAIVTVRFECSDPPIDQTRVEMLQRRVPVRTVDVQSGSETTGDEFARTMTPFAFMFLMFMGAFGISQGLLTGLIEEKSSRVVEMLLSAVSPLQLMAGKIAGMASVGLVTLTVWAVVGYWGAKTGGAAHLVTIFRLSYAGMYFVPGFLLVAALLAAIGAACNTLKDAQSLGFPINIITIVPMVMWIHVTQNPNSTLSLVLSFIPPITPFIMILRICADPNLPLWQIIATLAVLWLSVFAAVWAAARVFRIGVLMYGKPPSLFELLKWIRQS